MEKSEVNHQTAPGGYRAREDKVIDLQKHKDIAWAAVTDAANRHMKSHGRKSWSKADYNYAVSEFNRLLPEKKGGK